MEHLKPRTPAARARWLALAFAVTLPLGAACVRDPVPEAGESTALPPGLFLMDLVPATGVGLYTVAGPSKATMTGGVFRLTGDNLTLLSQDMVFAHNIAPYGDGYVATDTDRPFAAILDRQGLTVQRIERIVWRDGSSQPLAGCNWLEPVPPAEVARFLPEPTSGAPHFLVCVMRHGPDETMWWSLCRLEGDTLRSSWELAAARKAHAALLADGVFYGAASADHTLVVRGRGLELDLPVGDVRYMALEGGVLWMAGSGFVRALEPLPPAPDAVPRTFCSGVGRAQAVRPWRDRVYVTANGTLLVFDRAGRLERSVGQPPPPPGDSWQHDALRALGYIQ